MDFGRSVSRDGQRVLGPSKTWAGFIVGTLFAMPFGFLQAYLILIAPPPWQLVPSYGTSVIAAVPVVLLLTAGALAGDALGSFIKRRLRRPSGTRSPLLDQLPFVAVPILVGALLFPTIFVPTFFSLEAVIWVLIFTLGLHTGFNWIGYKIGAKKVPW
jgi:CDP-2,3-bis-(O-geranylgeranyl)-sn-glycerol synthase